MVATVELDHSYTFVKYIKKVIHALLEQTIDHLILYRNVNVKHYLKSIFLIGCKNINVYGNNCDIPCPINCKDNKCHVENGTCFGCKPGWIGLNCNSSMVFFY